MNKVIFILCMITMLYGCGQPDNAAPDEARYRGNICGFIKNPFTFPFPGSGDLKKNLIRKFGRPRSMETLRDPLLRPFCDYSRRLGIKTGIYYPNMDFMIFRTGTYQIFQYMYSADFSYVKHAITARTTVDDLHGIFGPNHETHHTGSSITYRTDCGDPRWRYLLRFTLRDKRVTGFSIETREK